MRYYAVMRRPGRLFIQILLLSVVLNLADWPYVDEIIENSSAGTLTELLAAKPADPGKMQGPATKLQMGYQVLAGLQTIASEPLRVPVPAPEMAAAAEPRLVLLSSIPQRIDRPPKQVRDS